MVKMFLSKGKVCLASNVSIVFLGIIIFGFNHLSVAKADPQQAGDSIPAKVQQLRKAAAMHATAGQNGLARQSYSEIVAGYSGTEYAMDALCEIGRLYAQQADDSSVAKVIEQLFTKYSTQPRVTRAIDRVAEGYIKNHADRAQAIYAEAIKRISGHSDVAWLHGASIRCQITQQDFTEAEQSINAFKKNYSKYPDLCTAIYSLAENCRNWKKYDKAKDLFQYVFQSSSNSSMAIKGLTGVGRCEIRLKNDSAVKQVIETLKSDYSRHEDFCVRLYDLSYEYWYVNDYIKSKDLCQYIIHEFPDNSMAIKAQRGVARCEIRLGNDSAADKAVKTLMSDYSQHKDLCGELETLALEYLWRKDYISSKSIWQYIFQKSLDKSFATKAQAEIVRCEMALGNDDAVDQAIIALKKNSAKNMVCSELLDIAGRFLKMKKYDKARELFKYISQESADIKLQINAQILTVRCETAVGNEIAVKKEIDTLNALLNKNVQRDNVSSRDILDMAGLLEGQGQYDKAKEFYQNVSQNSSNVDTVILAQVGILRCEMGLGNDSALEQQAKAIEEEFKNFKPKGRHFYNGLLGVINLLEKNKKHGIAKELYRCVSENSPHNDSAMGAQRGLIRCEMALGNVDSADQAIVAIKNYPKDKKAYAELLSIADLLYKEKKFKRARDIYQGMSQNSSDNNILVKTGAAIINCEQALGGAEAVDKAIEILKEECTSNKTSFWVLQGCVSHFYSQKKIDKARDLVQYVYRNASDRNLGAQILQKSVMQEYSSGNHSGAEPLIKQLMEGAGQDEFQCELVHYLAKRYWDWRLRDKANTLYKYVAKNSPNRDIAIDSQRWVVDYEIRVNNIIGAESALDTLKKEFSSHPSLVKVMFDIANSYVLERRLGNPLMHQKATDLFEEIINKYPKSRFVLQARCSLLLLSLKNSREGYVSEEFKKFLNDTSKDSRYFDCLNYMLRSDLFGLNKSQKCFILDNMGDVMSNYTGFDNKKKVFDLLVKYSDSSYYNKGFDDFAVFCANNGKHDSFVQILDGLTMTNKYYLATNLCKSYLNSNASESDIKAITLKLYKSKIDDGVSTPELSEQLDAYIAENMSANKKLAYEAILLKGRMLVRLGEIDEAIKLYEIYKNENPNSKKMPEVLYFIGYSYLIQGDTEKAKSSFTMILNDFPISDYTTRAKTYIQRINAISN